MNCPQCGKQMAWPHEVQLCDECFAKLDPIPKLVGKPVTLIWDRDWDRIVERMFGKPYCFQQQGDMRPQDSIWTFTVPENFDNWDIEGVDADIQEWLSAEPGPNEEVWGVSGGKMVRVERPRSEWPMSEFSLRLWWLRENYPDFDSIMCAVARRGLIDPGNYALHIWW